MADITVVFQDLTPTALRVSVESPGSGAVWRGTAYPVSGWPSGQNASGDLSIPISGYEQYQTSLVPSGSMWTLPFSTDVTVTLAVFAVED